MPITDALAQMHDRQVPSLSYEQLRERTRAICEQMGVPCLDLGVGSGQYALFYDAFHVNAAGRAVLTEAIGQWIASGKPAREAMTEAQLQRLTDRVLAADAGAARLTNVSERDALSPRF